MGLQGYAALVARCLASPHACRRLGAALGLLLIWLLSVSGFAGVGDGSKAPRQSAGAAHAAGAAASGARLPAPRIVRFVKLVELTEIGGRPYASIAEFNLIDATGATIDRKGWVATADSFEATDAPANAIDGDPNSLWHTPWQHSSPPPPHEFIVKLAAPTKVSGFRYLPRRDTSANGTIAKYRLHVSADGVDWGDPVSVGDFTTMGPISAEKTVLFAQQTPNHPPVVAIPAAQLTTMGQSVALQISASDPDGDPLKYTASGLPAGLAISPSSGLIWGTPIVPGDYTVALDVSDNKGAGARLALKWRVDPAPALPGANSAAPGEVRFVKLEELSERSGQPWGSIAEFNLIDANGTVLPRTGWVALADSADISDKPEGAIDGNPLTLWHTQWNEASPPPPHSFIIDMHRSAKVAGFTLLPRQDHSSNGMIARFRFYTSVDGFHWSRPLVEGDFSTMGAPNAIKKVTLR